MEGETRYLVLNKELKTIEEPFYDRLARVDKEFEKQRIAEDIKKHETMTEIVSTKILNKSLLLNGQRSRVKSIY